MMHGHRYLHYEGFKVSFTGVWDHPVHKEHGTKASINLTAHLLLKRLVEPELLVYE